MFGDLVDTCNYRIGNISEHKIKIVETKKKRIHHSDDEEDNTFYYRYSSVAAPPPSNPKQQPSSSAKSSAPGSGYGGLAPSKSTLYISNLDFSLTNSDIHTLFSTFGKVARVTVLKDRHTRRLRGGKRRKVRLRKLGIGLRRRRYSRRRNGLRLWIMKLERG